MTKVLLVVPLNESFDSIMQAPDAPWKQKLNSNKSIKRVDATYPSGVLSIASYLAIHHKDTTIKIMDLNVHLANLEQKLGKNIQAISKEDFWESAFSILEDFTPDIIGISSLFCSTIKDMKSFVIWLKNKYSKSFLIGGGHMLAAIYSEVYAKGYLFDAICYGEGEIPFVELLYAYKKASHFDYVENNDSWITKNKIIGHFVRGGGGVCNNPFKPKSNLIVDLDEIPPYRFEFLVFGLRPYESSSNYFFIVESSKLRKDFFMFTTRGCPHHCIFCASQNVHGHEVRYYSTERIKSDIEYYRKQYGITCFWFYDDHFLYSKERAIDIINFIVDNKLNAQIPTPAFWQIDSEVASAMKKAGITEINLTIENGNQNTLSKIINKAGNLKHAKTAVENLRNVGIIANTNLLFGLPGETKDSIEIGIENMKTIGCNWHQCFVTAPLPGSRLWDLCKEKNYFVENIDIFDMDFKRCVIKTPDFDPEYIEKKVYETNLSLNFVNNNDMARNEYSVPLLLFERIINERLSTHAFAYYYASICCEKLGFMQKHDLYKQKYDEMIEIYPFWKQWADFFHL